MRSLKETKILVVEDDTFLRTAISRCINQYGFIPLEAANGQDGLSVFRNEHPQLILTDLRMPVMSGFELLWEVAKESPETPVIIFSGMWQRQNIDEALRCGAIDYIIKPVEADFMLINKIEKALLMAKNRTSSTNMLTGHGQAKGGIDMQMTPALTVNEEH
jgi:DNA-binding NtrC family response regulator